MRVLVVSNCYPPHHQGGYEIGCRDAVEMLARRGHELCVLTSVRGVGRPVTDEPGAENSVPILRWLRSGGWSSKLRPYLLAKLPRREFVNQRAFTRVLEEFEPDVVFLWNLVGISISCAFQAQAAGVPTSWFVFDDWLAAWDRDPWTRRRPEHRGQPVAGLLAIAERVLRLQPTVGELDIGGAIFASAYLRRTAHTAGLEVEDAPIVPWGLELERYPLSDPPPGPPHLIYAGQIVRHKGVHTAIEALARVHAAGHLETRLTIAGGLYDEAYAAELRELVRRLGLEDRVLFAGALEQTELIARYREHHVLLFPSTWQEPFGIVRLEGMALGLPVVSTRTGAAEEIHDAGETGLLFEAGDADGCAAAVLRLLEDAELRERIRVRSRIVVERRYRLERVIDEIEGALAARCARVRAGDRLGT